MKPIRKQFIISLALIALCTALGFFISWRISLSSKESFQDIVSCTGLVVTVIGIIFSLKGSPSGIVNRMGSQNIFATLFYENETTIEDRKTNPYHKGFRNNKIVQFTPYRLSIVFAGILLFVISILM